MPKFVLENAKLLKAFIYIMPKNDGVFNVQFHNTNLALKMQNGWLKCQNGQQTCFNWQHVAYYLLPKKFWVCQNAKIVCNRFNRYTNTPPLVLTFLPYKFLGAFVFGIPVISFKIFWHHCFLFLALWFWRSDLDPLFNLYQNHSFLSSTTKMNQFCPTHCNALTQ